MAGSDSAKGNPASRRMSNPKRKTRREACWQRGQKRKEARRKAADLAQQRNEQTRKDGGLTLWDQAKIKRAARRESDRNKAA